MKHAKKLASLMITLVMLLTLGMPAFAQNITGTDADGATITITNASKGETYKIYKLFAATVTGKDGGSIAYTGTVPEELKAYFEANEKGNITVKDAAYKDAKTKADMSEGLQGALKTWAETATVTANASSDGTTLVFKGLAYGYYVVTTTQGESVITVTSTNPNATIVDKNSSTPKELKKSADKTDYNIGDTVTYTVSFKTANYYGAGNDAKKIVSYTIEDTLPDFLSNVKVTSIIVDEDGNAETIEDQTDVTAPFADKKITLDWYDKEETKFKYKNGAVVTLTYTATLTEKAAIDGNGNKNTVTVSWKDENGGTTPEGSKLIADTTIFTYAIALKKVNQEGEALSGATFKLPFYVKSTANSTDGAYIYAGIAEGDGLVNTVTTSKDGLIIIKGVKAGTYKITETAAPKGYNVLTESFNVEAVKTGETVTETTTYLDADGNIIAEKTDTSKEVIVKLENIAANVKVVVNKTGSILPSTGGMGTAVFYILGSLLVICAAVMLVVKRRMSRSAK